MNWFFKQVSDKAGKLTDKLSEMSRDELLYHAIPHFLGEIMENYFRMEVEGLENIPRTGSGIIASNHSGYSGFDAFLLCHHIYQETKRTPRVLTHHFWFLNKTTAIPAKRMGFIEATRKNGEKTLKQKKLLLIFPEGEYGNFKPTTKRYQLQDFKKGVIRLALQTKSPIIPTIVIGAEETHINLAQLKFTKFLRGLVLPLPLNVLPLPAKWKIKFLPPFELKHGPEALEDQTLLRHLAEDFRDYMQIEIDKELKKRKTIFI